MSVIVRPSNAAVWAFVGRAYATSAASALKIARVYRYARRSLQAPAQWPEIMRSLARTRNATVKPIHMFSVRFRTSGRASPHRAPTKCASPFRPAALVALPAHAWSKNRDEAHKHG